MSHSKRFISEYATRLYDTLCKNGGFQYAPVSNTHNQYAANPEFVKNSGYKIKLDLERFSLVFFICICINEN